VPDLTLLGMALTLQAAQQAAEDAE
jgi:hypothetical protein